MLKSLSVDAKKVNCEISSELRNYVCVAQLFSGGVNKGG